MQRFGARVVRTGIVLMLVAACRHNQPSTSGNGDASSPEPSSPGAPRAGTGGTVPDGPG